MNTVLKLILLVLASLVLAVPVHADGPPGVISGQVVNGTADGTISGIAQVALGVYRGDSLEREVQAPLDEAGRFRIEGLEVGDDLTYQLGAAYADMLYRSDPIKLTESQAEQQATLTVYEQTPTDPGLRASQVFISLNIAKDNPQELVVSEFIRLVNPADRTFVPQSGSPDGPMNVVRFGLPPGASQFQPGFGLDARQVVQVDRGVASLAPVPPGDSVFRFAFRVPFEGATDVLEQSLPYGADVLRVMAEDGGPTVAGPALAFEQTVDGRGGKIRVWAGRDLAPGTQLSIELSDLPVPSIWAHLADAFANPRVVAALAALAAALLPVLGVFWVRRGRARPVLPASEASTLDALAEKLAELDEARARGRLSDPEYQERRQRLKLQLRKQLLASHMLPTTEHATP